MKLVKGLGIMAIACVTALVAFEGKAQTVPFSPYAQSIIPRNNYKIPAWQESGNELDEKMFNAVISRVEGIYSPLISRNSRGQLKLVVERRWTDPTVNAYAERRGNILHVAMFGGLARHREITPDGFALVVCHEIGHHIGGFPKIAGEDWASNEGQSDYFGTAKCMRKVLTGLDNYNFNRSVYISQRRLLNDVVAQKCYAAHRGNVPAELCIRNAGAAMSLARFFGSFERVTPRFETPDPRQVRTTNDAHPDAQCRLDTYFNGALCPISDAVDMPDNNPNVGACVANSQFAYAQRPRCWFAPPTQAFRF